MLSIKNNLMADTAARHLSRAYNGLSASVQRLSSGLRINSAKDDAAGMAVRELLRADIASLNQGSRNAADAVSMLQTGEGGLAVIDDLLVRMRELAEQASTDSYSAAQRTIMDGEFQQLADEITRIANNTAFNNNNLLTSVQDDAFTISLGQGTAQASQTIRINSRDMTANGLGLGTGDLVTGSDAYHQESFISGNVTMAADKDAGVYMRNNGAADADLRIQIMGSALGGIDVTFGHDVAETDVANVGTAGASDAADYVTASADDATITITYDGVTKVLDKTTVTNADLVAALTTSGTAAGLDDLAAGINELFNGEVGDSGNVLYNIAKADTTHVLKFENNSFGDVADMSMTATGIAFTNGGLGLVTGSFTNTDGDTGAMTLQQLVDAINTESAGVADGDANALGEIASVGSSAGGALNWLVLTGNSQYKAEADIVTDSQTAVITNPGSIVWAGGAAAGTTNLSVTQEGSEATVTLGAQETTSIATQTLAQDAISRLEAAIESKDTFRAHLGYMMNRLESAATVIDIKAENLKTAEGRISDVDVATEMAAMTRTQVLAQAGISMLAQANSMPQMALKLLG